VEDVKEGILGQLINQKKVEKLISEHSGLVSGSETLEQLAEKFNTTVNHRAGLSFEGSDMSIEPALLGAVAAAEKGKVTGPVKGEVGVYYFTVTEDAVGEYYTEADALNRNMQKEFSVLQKLNDIVSEEAGVKDYRAKFY
jgi:peptidyl-prolyl cis-trans isomerase D